MFWKAFYGKETKVKHFHKILINYLLELNIVTFVFSVHLIRNGTNQGTYVIVKTVIVKTVIGINRRKC